ncbi:7717_t:CDS:2 [Cetraspora pellucida]|uniref:7717_t:CDS:1 n=1 Tax=Cetraspora pellucida TaxID=1433469 RepID=A0ACA9K3A5_9GLOM|nr:7717_t:CDS:2 [Cetraspora pellucida]
MVNNVNAQQYINDKYPINGVCTSKSDQVNKGKPRDEITILDLSKGKVGKGRFNDGKTLEGSLKLEGFTNLQTLIISSQQITSLDLSNCHILKKLDLSNCPRELTENKEAIKSSLILNLKKTKLVKGPIVTTVGENDVRNILIGKKYHFIDNIGFGDTSKDTIKEEDILRRIGEGIYSTKEGINQILFVVKGNFEKKHIEAFKVFENFISETGMAKFTTIVKTGFSNFRDQPSCERDKKALIGENKELEEIIGACNEVLHIDNPSMAVEGQKKKINKEDRERSREIVLNYLAEKYDINSLMDEYKKIEENSDKTEVGSGQKKEAESNLFKELKVKLAANVQGLFGKSTLANVLINPVGEFAQVFTEGDLSVSQTRNIQSESVRHEFIEREETKRVLYKVIDTPGIGDTKLSPEEILDIIGEAVYLVRDGVSRVFFVTNDRFDQYETATYDLLRKTIFDDQITNYTTIVRTNFETFRKKEECEQDIKEMKENDSLKEIIESCQGRVIHVNNPPTELKGVSEERIKINKDERRDSKKILLDHLKEVCRKDDTYNPQNLKALTKKVYERIEKKKKLSEALDKLQKQLKRVEGKIEDKKLSQVITDLNKEMEKESKTIQRAIFEHIQSKELISKVKPQKKSKEDKEINVMADKSEKDKDLSDEIKNAADQIREVIDERQQIKNILIVGRVGSGKSTLANVITGTDKFNESNYGGISETKNIQTEEVEIDGVQYRIIDTIGAGDTRLTKEEVLNKLTEMVNLTKNGLNQVLLVISGRFTQEEIEMFKLLKSVIFDEDIGKYTTIVRTRFEDFRNLQQCEYDHKFLLNENKEIREMIESCNGVIYVNNPPIYYKYGEEDSDERDRKDSRQRLLSHLETCQDIYKPKN